MYYYGLLVELAGQPGYQLSGSAITSQPTASGSVAVGVAITGAAAARAPFAAGKAATGETINGAAVTAAPIGSGSLLAVATIVGAAVPPRPIASGQLAENVSIAGAASPPRPTAHGALAIPTLIVGRAVPQLPHASGVITLGAAAVVPVTPAPVVTATAAPTGSVADMLGRLKAVLPNRWFPDPGNAPVLDGILSGIAWIMAYIYALLQYVASQRRIATATDVNLDIISQDFFGAGLPRKSSEQDLAFRTRIQANLLPERATRAAVSQAVVTLTGTPPTIFEPANTTDTGGYSAPPAAPWSYFEDFTLETVLSSAWTFQRPSTATYTDATGTIRVAPLHVPRFDHDASGNQIGLLIEESRTNLVLHSGDLTQWNNGGGVITATGQPAPDGSHSAALLAAPSSNGLFYVTETLPAGGSPSTTYTASVYAAAAGYNFLHLQLWDFVGGTGIEAWFNLATGAVGTVQSSGAGASGAHAAIIKAPLGMYRCVLTGIPTTHASPTIEMVVRVSQANGDNTITGNGSSGIIAWGAQTEIHDVPSSYIPTTSAVATRAADSCIMSGAAFSNWFSDSMGGTLLWEGQMPVTPAAFIVYSGIAITGPSGDSVDIYGVGTGTGLVSMTAVIGGNPDYAANAPVASLTVPFRGVFTIGSAITYSANGAAGAFSGGGVQSGLPNGLNAMQLQPTSSGWHRRIAYYPTVRSMTDIAMLSAPGFVVGTELTVTASGLAYGPSGQGGYGALDLPFQAFIQAYRPHSGGVSFVAGYYEIGSGLPAIGGYDVGAIEYVTLDSVAPVVTDADIYAAIADAAPAASIMWTSLRDFSAPDLPVLLQPSGPLLDVNFILNVSTLSSGAPLLTSGATGVAITDDSGNVITDDSGNPITTP